jgi:hypothetical protein
LTDVVQRGVFDTAKQGIIIAWNPRARVGVCNDPDQHADGQDGAVLCHTAAKDTACRCFADVGDFFGFDVDKFIAIFHNIACLDLPIYDLVFGHCPRFAEADCIRLVSHLFLVVKQNVFSKKITGTSSIAG